MCNKCKGACSCNKADAHDDVDITVYKTAADVQEGMCTVVVPENIGKLLEKARKRLADYIADAKQHSNRQGVYAGDDAAVEKRWRKRTHKYLSECREDCDALCCVLIGGNTDLLDYVQDPIVLQAAFTSGFASGVQSIMTEKLTLVETAIIDE
jgi:hypothetical protein